MFWDSCLKFVWREWLKQLPLLSIRANIFTGDIPEKKKKIFSRISFIYDYNFILVLLSSFISSVLYVLNFCSFFISLLSSFLLLFRYVLEMRSYGINEQQ